MKKIVEIITELLAKKSKTCPLTWTVELNLRSDLGLDSLDLAELTVRIENEFGVDVFEDGIVETVGEILEKLEQSK